MGKVFHSKQPVSFKEKAMPSGDVYIINPPKAPSWILVASHWAYTWLWEPAISFRSCSLNAFSLP